MQKLYQKLAHVSLYAAVLLVPITFLPWTVDALEVNKQTVLLILTSVAAIAWLGDMVVRKQFAFKQSWVFIVLALFLIATAIASALSIAPYSSWVGSGLQEYTSFLSLLSFGILFVIGAHVLAETKVQRIVWTLSLIASALVGLFISLAMVGVPLFATNFIGTPNSLGLYLAVMAIVGSGLWLVSNDKANEKDVLPAGAFGVVAKVAIVLTVLSTLFVTLSIDYWLLWAALILGTGVIFTFALIRAHEFPSTSRFVLPMVLFVVSIVFLFLPSVLSNKFAVEVAPNYSTTFSIATQTMQDTSWFFGSGPGTFVMDYVKFRPEEVNQSRFWDVRFDRGSSHVLTMLTTFGIVGTSLFLIFLVSLVVLALHMLITERVHDEWKMTFVTFSGWVVLACGVFVYSSNFTLSFLFWLLSAVLMSQTGNKMQVWEFSKNPRFALLTAFLFVLVNVGLLTVMFVTTSRYASEISFAKAVEQHRQGAPIELVVEQLESAARLNRLNDIYARNLAHGRLLLIGEALQDPAVNPSDLAGLVESTIFEAQRAVQLSPNNVVNYSLLGDVLRELSPLATNADILAVQAYNATVELAPNNPKYRASLGRALLVRADQLSILAESEDEETASKAQEEKDTVLGLAVDAFKTAIELKSDYASAHYHLSLAYVRQGNLSEAIDRMESVASVSPNDVGVAFQLGLLYLQQGRNDLARAQLERAVAIAPNYSNARWYLAAVYEQEGDIDGAIAQVEAVLEANPDNEAVQSRLDRLKAGPEEPEEEIPEPLEEGESDPTNLETEADTSGEVSAE